MAKIAIIKKTSLSKVTNDFKGMSSLEVTSKRIICHCDTANIRVKYISVNWMIQCKKTTGQEPTD